MPEDKNSPISQAPAAVPPTTTGKPGDAPKLRRRRWPWVLLTLLVLLLIVVLVLPSLLCTGPGVRIIEGQVNSRIKGHLTIGSLSLGWFSPAVIKNVTLSDARGAVIARNLTVKTQVSLLRAISDWHQFGKVDIHIGQLQLVTQSNGLNIARALASRSSASSTKVVSTPAPAQPATSSSSALPVLNGQLDLTIDKLQWASPSAPTLNATATALHVVINTTGKPLDFNFSTTVAAQPHPPAVVKLDGKLNVFANSEIVAADKITGTVTADIHSLNLAVLDPMLAAMGVRLNMAGTLNGQVALALPQPGQGQAKVLLKFAALKLGGQILKGDTPTIGDVAIPLTATWNQQSFNISSAQINSPLATLTLRGAGAISAITGMLDHTPHNGQSASINLTGKANIAELAGQFPHLFGVPTDTQFTRGTATVGVEVAIGSKTAAPVATATGVKATLPLLAGRVRFAVDAVSWKSPLYPLARTANADGQITFDTNGKPLQTVVHITVLHGTKTPSTVNLNGNILVFGQQTILPLTSITGSMHLKIGSFYLDYLNPILNRFHAPLQMHGLLSANLQLGAPTAGSGAITGELAIANCGFQGSFIKQDNPELGLVQVPVKLAWQHQNITISNLGVLSQALKLQVHGTASLNSLRAIAANQPAWGQAHLAADVQADLHLLAAAFPHTLGLRKDHVKIHAGTLGLTAVLNSQAHGAAASVKVSLSSLTGELNQRPFSIYPALLALHATRSTAARWTLTTAQVRQAATATGNPATAPIFSAEVTADPTTLASYTIQMAGDLQPLTGELAQLEPTGGYSDSGQWTLVAHVAGVGTPLLSCNLKTAIKNAALVLVLNKPAYTDPDIRIATNVKVTMPNNQFSVLHCFSAVHCTLFTLHTAFADIGPATAEIRKDAAGTTTIPSFDLPIQRLSITKVEALLQTLAVNTGPYSVGGKIVNSNLIGAAAGTQVTLSSLHLVLQDLALAARHPANGPVFKEPSLTVAMAGSMNLGPNKHIALKPLHIATADKLLSVSCPGSLVFAESPAGLEFSCHALTAKANLHLLGPLLAALNKLPPADQLNGLATITAQASAKGPVFAVATNATITNYQITVPKSTLKLPPTNVTLTMVGRGNLAKHQFICLKDCGVAEKPPTGGTGDSVVIKQGSALGWGTGAAESVTGSVNYDLQRLQTLLAPWLPAGLVMQGQKVMPLAISGQYANGTGLRQFRKLTVAPTAFGFDNISIDGIHLGPGQIAFQVGHGVINLIPSSIPANQGSLNLAGEVQLARKNPAFVLTTPLHLVENMQMNTALGSSVLKFLPIAWGMSFKPGGGVAKVSGVLNLSLKNADIPLSSARLKQVGTLAGTVSATHVSSDSPLYTLLAKLNPQHFLNLSSGQARLKDSGIRPTQFHLQAGKVYYKDMKVVLASMGVAFSGWVAMDNTLDVDVSITDSGMAVPLPVEITGNTAHPSMKLSGKPLKNLGKNLGNTLKHAGGLFKNLFH